jgi:small subunit ribosomal protein S21
VESIGTVYVGRASADWALKVFKRTMLQSGILRELRRRRHHVKPSEARSIKSKAAKRARDKARKNALRRSAL